MAQDRIIDLFIANAAKTAGEPVRVHDDEDLKRVLDPILRASDTIFCPAVTEKEKTIFIPSEKRVEDYITAAVCVEEVFGAIAETGSLICSSQMGTPLQAGLVATHHVALVSKENIYENLDDFFGKCGDTPPTNMVLETGPSRTADIELTLTIGVHGPGRLSIIVF